MKKKDKEHVMERKQKRKRGETIEDEEPSPELGSTAAEDFDGESPNNMEEEEGMDLEEAASSSKDDSYQKEFKILGQTEFAPLKKINFTTSWVSNATLFPAELHERNLADLSSVFGIPDALLNLVRKRIQSWFPVQKSVLPYLLHDITHVPPVRPRDIAISAPTGSGKTLCYVLPILAQIGARPCGRLRALVIAPVQTLVKQIEQEFNSFNAYGATISALSGATDFSKEQKHLAPNGTCTSDVIVSTPGRLMDHLTDPSSGIILTSLRFLVIDEADRIGPMARQEWLESVERRSGGLTRCANLTDIALSRWAPRKILLSATLSRDVEDLHMWNLFQPRLFRANVSESKEINLALQTSDHVTGELSLPSTIRHTVLAVEKQFHPLVLYLKIVEHDWQKVLVFTNEKESSQRLAILISRLARSKFRVEQLTGDLYGNRRIKVLRRFKTGTTRVLICSDVLSRGVDVEGIDCVVNYELPKNDRLFVHRAGRTGRAGRLGHVLSLGDGEERKIFVKNVLRKNGLWVNAEEEVVERNVYENHLGRYEKALAHLKKELVATNAIAKDKKPKVSGFAYRKKSRYHVIKEKLKANNAQPWRKEKKDFVV